MIIKDLPNKEILSLIGDSADEINIQCFVVGGWVRNYFLKKETKTFINTYSYLLPKAAPERIQAELLKIVSVVDADQVIQLVKEMDFLGIWRNQDSLID